MRIAKYLISRASSPDRYGARGFDEQTVVKA